MRFLHFEQPHILVNSCLWLLPWSFFILYIKKKTYSIAHTLTPLSFCFSWDPSGQYMCNWISILCHMQLMQVGIFRYKITTALLLLYICHKELAGYGHTSYPSCISARSLSFFRSHALMLMSCSCDAPVSPACSPLLAVSSLHCWLHQELCFSVHHVFPNFPAILVHHSTSWDCRNNSWELHFWGSRF
jgi:hypothetical protein